VAATVLQFRTVLPVFTEDLVADATIQTYLDMALRSMGDGFGTLEDDAQIFLAAHLMSMAGIGPGSKVSEMAGFTSIKVGSLALTRSEKAAAGEYAASPWGVLYWRLARGRSGTAIGVTGTGYPTGIWPYYGYRDGLA
jgi:hypothetical protein